MVVYDDAAPHLPACLFYELGIRAHADRGDEHVEGDALSALQKGGIFFKLRDAVVQIKFRPVRPEGALHDSGARLVEDAGQNVPRHVRHRDAVRPVRDAFEAFQPDQPRAEDEHPLLFARERLFEGERVVQRHEGEALFHLFKPRYRRREGARTRRDEQFIVLYLLPARKQNFLCLRVYLFRAGTGAEREIVLFVKVGGTVVHALPVRRAEKIIGDERPAVDGVFFVGEDDDLPLFVPRADLFRRGDARRRISDDDVLHAFTSPRTRWRCSGSASRSSAPRRDCRCRACTSARRARRARA